MYGHHIVIGFEGKDIEPALKALNLNLLTDGGGDSGLILNEPLIELNEKIAELQSQVIEEMIGEIVKNSGDYLSVSISGRMIEMSKSVFELYSPNDEDPVENVIAGIPVTGCYYPTLIDWEFPSGGLACGLTNPRMDVLNYFWALVKKEIPVFSQSYLCFPLLHY